MSLANEVETLFSELKAKIEAFVEGTGGESAASAEALEHLGHSKDAVVAHAELSAPAAAAADPP